MGAEPTVNQSLEVLCFVNIYAGYTSWEEQALGRDPKLSHSPPHLSRSYADFCAEAVAQATGGMVQRMAVQELWLEPSNPHILRDARFRVEEDTTGSYSTGEPVA